MKSPQALVSLVVAASGQSWIWTVENSSSQSASVISHFTVGASLTKMVSPWSGFFTFKSSAVHAARAVAAQAARTTRRSIVALVVRSLRAARSLIYPRVRQASAAMNWLPQFQAV